MIEFTALILKFADAGHMTGWRYIHIPIDIAQQLLPGNRRSFRIKGCLDLYKFEGLALLPMGDGSFCLPLNQTSRKALGKSEGAMLQVKIEVDKDFQITIPDYLAECLAEEPLAEKNFYKLTKSHREYFIKWIESAKTDETKTVRILRTLKAMSLGYTYSEMMRTLKEGF
ncbi:MAG: YdeI/OmpD-associated family protein [Sphingobacteriaceae bacterium]